MTKNLLCAALFVAALIGGGVAAEEKEMTKAEKRLQKIEQKYQATGERRQCISTRRMPHSVVIDDSTIFFSGLGKRGYMNRLARNCPKLAFENRFAYQTIGTQLCKSEIITVLDSYGSPWSSCALGDFEVWEKKPKEKSGETENQSE